MIRRNDINHIEIDAWRLLRKVETTLNHLKNMVCRMPRQLFILRQNLRLNVFVNFFILLSVVFLFVNIIQGAYILKIIYRECTHAIL